MTVLKKTLLLLLAVLMALSLMGCKQKNPDTLSDEPDSADNSHAGNSVSPQTSPDDLDIVIDNLVLADNDVCTFIINSANPHGEWGYVLDVFLENKLDVPLTFSINDSTVNDYMCSPYWSSQLQPQASEETQILWYGTDLNLNDISNVWEIEFLFRAADTETDEDAFSEVFTVYPYGDVVAAMASEPRVSSKEEQVLVETDDFTFIITRFDAETAFAYAISVYVENKSDVDVLFTLDTAKINGFNCNPYWAVKVLAGKKANLFVCWMEYDLTKYSITSVDEIEFLLKVYDANDWAALPLLHKTFTVSP